MSELERIADQLTRSVEGEAWHGPALLEILNDINSEKANARVVNNIHSIWEIVNHITAWQKAVAVRLEFKAIELDGEEDWPPVKDKSDEAWKSAIKNLTDSFENLRTKILQFPEEKLNELVPGKTNQNFYILLHGIIQHNLYHTGQIALIKIALYSFV